MAMAVIDGISTCYEVLGAGPPLLMYAPGGFNALIEGWRTQGVYAKLKLLDHLPKKYTCIVFDRRECGQSGGRIEPMSWALYVKQGKGLLEHLQIKRAHLMGGCMGCAPVTAFGVIHPETVLSMVLFWPVGGAKYRISSHAAIFAHLAFVRRRPRRGGGAGCQGRQAVWRRSARRTVGFGA
jgi:pimeloyl-ACP methyl ester carboxylesterase